MLITVDPMSHRKASKRRRETGGDDDFSPSFIPQKKRSKSHKGVEHGEGQEQNLSVDDSESGVRRSSRTPKPKVFDDEETVVIGRTPEVSKPGDSALIPPVEHSLSSTNSQQITPKNEASRQKNKVTAAYDVGHKRETRRSYQDYLKELRTETDVPNLSRDEFESVGQLTSKAGQNSRDKKITKVNSAKRKSDLIGTETTPKSTDVFLKTPKEKGPSSIRVKRETPDEASPKVRSSSRTPVPKRVFPLLEDEEKDELTKEVPDSPEVESESAELTSPKVRSSSRAHVPRKSFPFLEEEDDVKTSQVTPEQTSSKTRTPKLHGSKRRYSAAEEEGQQSVSNITPVTSEEPSLKVRVSSRGHKPKRTFSLLEGDEVPDETKKESIASEKIPEDERYVTGSLTEKQMGKVVKEPKRRKSGSSQQFTSNQRSSKEEGKQASNHTDKTPDGAHLPVKVESTEVSTMGALDSAAVKTPSSSKLNQGRSRSVESKEDQGSSSKRKGKPVKKKVTSPEQTPALTSIATDVKVKEEPKTVSDYETLATPKTTKSKSSSKKKQPTESSEKQSESLKKSTVTVKQENIGNKDSFSLSDLAMGVSDSLKPSDDLNTSVSKGSKKGKISKNTEQKTEKGKGKVLKKSKKDSSNSASEGTEQEHIILKLHLPQSVESTKHKKHHHHHHHHHHHKHKHSSGSHDDGSPKKPRHKKSAAKLSEDTTEADESQNSETKKKKISIKFKGLSSKNIDLEMAADSPGLMQSAELDAKKSSESKTKKQSKESSDAKSTEHSKESAKKKKKAKQADLSSSQSESEPVKLVIKKDKIPSGDKSEVKKKKSEQPAATQAKAGNQKKKTVHVAASKKSKAGTTPVKTSKSPEVCLNLSFPSLKLGKIIQICFVKY